MDSKHPEYYGALHNYGHIMLGQITDPKGKFNVSKHYLEHEDYTDLMADL